MVVRAVGGAGGIGNNMVFIRVILFLVNPKTIVRYRFWLGGNNSLLGPAPNAGPFSLSVKIPVASSTTSTQIPRDGRILSTQVLDLPAQ